MVKSSKKYKNQESFDDYKEIVLDNESDIDFVTEDEDAEYVFAVDCSLMTSRNICRFLYQ